ncbi:hypothetical protein M1446_05510 [Candidatus Dependentiae bacterium]|nr:hypothetical protein [Candidatus Dependentiae bacterium]
MNFKLIFSFLCLSSLSQILPMDQFPCKENILGLPVNLGKSVLVAVIIPENFKMIQSEPSPLMEFIPKTETPDKWSHIISTQIFMGSNLTAEFMMNHIKYVVVPNGVTNIKLLEEFKENKDSYSVAYFAVAYTKNGRREVLFAKYFSGPYDCSGIQYTIAIKDPMTDEAALKIMKEYIEKNVQIV